LPSRRRSALRPGLDPEGLERAARRTLEHAIGELGEAADGIEIEPRLREGQPADVLVAEAADAELLVVGSRGLGGFRELLLGSVSHQCAQHAPCPVLIVRRKHHG
jgi:nucleotide-binding universal stress UspA family protein